MYFLADSKDSNKLKDFSELTTPPHDANAGARQTWHELSKRCIVALSVLAVLAVVNQFIAQYALGNRKAHAGIINIAGRQRMFSQRITKDVLLLQHAADKAELQNYAEDLRSTIEAWKKAHQGLQTGSDELNLPGENSPHIARLFADLKPHYEAITAAADLLLKLAETSGLASPEASPEVPLLNTSPLNTSPLNTSPLNTSLPNISAAVNQTLAHEKPFLEAMERIVRQYEAEDRADLMQLRQLQALLLGLTLLTLILEGLFIFQPIVRRVRTSFIKVERASERLSDSEARLRDLFDNANDLIYTHDLDGNFTSLNKAGERLTGYTQAEALQMNLKDVVKPQYLKLAREMTRRKNIDGKPTQYELEITTRAGESLILEIGSRVIYEKGLAVGVQGIARDVTLSRRAAQELRAAHQKLSFHVQNSPVGVVEWDADTRITGWSLEAERIFGWKAEEVIGKIIDTDFLFIHVDDKQLVIETVTDLLIGKIQRLVHHNRNYTKTGEIVYCEWYNSALRDEAGNLVSMMSLALDVTERERITSELKATRDAALESARLKSEFLANMSHEIRTPMNGVIGMTSLLLDCQLNQEQREYAEIIRTSGNALLTVINDILDFSKIEAGKLTFEVVDFDLRAVVEDTLELLAERAQAKHLEIASIIFTDVPTQVQGDPGRLRQVLVNLIGNAIKFTERGQVIVKVKPVTEDAEEVRVCIEIADSGIGISENQIGKLFAPFMQADGSTTRRYGGTGLGLAIAKELVELMRGEVSVESTEGAGSVFSFTACFAKQQARTSDTSDHAVYPNCLEAVRVLIVDANEATHQVLHQQTMSWGCDVQVAANLADALAMLRRAATENKSFAVAIFDLKLLEPESFAVLRAMKADDLLCDTKIVLLPTLKERKQAEIGRAFGVDAYLTKPVKERQLHQVLINMLASEQTKSQINNFNQRRETGSLPLLSSLTLTRSASAKDFSLLKRYSVYEAFDNNDSKGDAARSIDKLISARAETNASANHSDAWHSSSNDSLIPVPRVLVAEDNEVNQMLAVRYLEKLGCEATVAGNGLQALEILARERFDVVLMDCQMPGLDGYETTRRVRESEAAQLNKEGAPAASTVARIPIIAMTAYARDADRALCLEIGMDDYLSKPASLEDLRRVLNRWLPNKLRAMQETTAQETTAQETAVQGTTIQGTTVQGTIAQETLAQEIFTQNAAAAASSPLLLSQSSTRAMTTQQQLNDKLNAAVSEIDFLAIDRKVLGSYREFQDADEPDLITEVIDMYFVSAPQKITTMREGIDGADAAKVENAAHALRGSSASLGVEGVALAAQRLESFARAGDLRCAQAVLERLETCWQSVKMRLEIERFVEIDRFESESVNDSEKAAEKESVITSSGAASNALTKVESRIAAKF